MKKSGLDWSNIGNKKTKDTEFEPTNAHHFSRAHLNVARTVVCAYDKDAITENGKFAMLDTAWLASTIDPGLILGEVEKDEETGAEQLIGMYKCVDSVPLGLKLWELEGVEMKPGEIASLLWVPMSKHSPGPMHRVVASFNQFKVMGMEPHICRAAGGIVYWNRYENVTLPYHICRSFKLVGLTVVQMELMRDAVGAPKPKGRRSRASLVRAIMSHLGFTEEEIDEALDRLKTCKTTTGAPNNLKYIAHLIVFVVFCVCASVCVTKCT